MPEPRFRTRTNRKIQKKLPGGKTVDLYSKGKPRVAKCANCGKSLKGIPRERQHKMKKLGKTKKRPERPYGGNLCSDCARNLIKTKAREIS